MALYIKDPDVDALADELKRLTNAPTKAEAVRVALRRSVDLARQRLPMEDRLAKAFAIVDPDGPFGPGDHKTTTDELWGED
ncbi:type II toxin-antitoxin system VapB family antitoxin [Aureimonas sp. SK2]|uniref:type II toxin-antitoxin system VapB family antitoxin n=1 Tax=Aureimonas sp. SK2 TaxID=3015992 RepID=UPI0024438796|nr:type II toxin-antitoxin system VapB family antitoxin [Aureimonas sp. SK2]